MSSAFWWNVFVNYPYFLFSFSLSLYIFSYPPLQRSSPAKALGRPIPIWYLFLLKILLKKNDVNLKSDAKVLNFMPLITVVNSHFTYSVNCLWYELKFRFQDNDPFVSHFCFQPLIFYYCCGLQVTFLANRVKPPGLPVGCLCVCNGDLLWLNVQTDRAGFWFERYHRTQLLCVKWGVRIHRGEAELPDKSKKSETYAHQFVFFLFHGGVWI